MLTDFCNVLHRIYWANKQHKTCWFVRRGSPRSGGSNWGRVVFNRVRDAISRKRCEIELMWQLIINSNSYVGFRLQQKLMTLNDLERRCYAYCDQTAEAIGSCSFNFRHRRMGTYAWNSKGFSLISSSNLMCIAEVQCYFIAKTTWF